MLTWTCKFTRIKLRTKPCSKEKKIQGMPLDFVVNGLWNTKNGLVRIMDAHVHGLYKGGQ